MPAESPANSNGNLTIRLAAPPTEPKIRISGKCSNVMGHTPECVFRVTKSPNGQVATQAAPPRVKWQRDAKGEEFVSVPEVCGPFAWAQLHSWAQNLNDRVCPSCGQFAIAAAKALHDVVNAKLGKRVRYPAELKTIAGFFQQAASGTLKVEAHQHLQAQVRAIDVSGDGPITEYLSFTRPDQSREHGPHKLNFKCAPGEPDKCKLVSVEHPRAEETNVLEDALALQIQIKSPARADTGFTRQFSEAMAAT